MNIFKKILTFGAIGLTSATLITSNTYASSSDDIDWSDLTATYTYNTSTETLKLHLSVDEASTPDDIYTAKITLNGNTETKTFKYNSSTDELYIDYSIQVDQDDVDDTYKATVKVTNETDDDTEYKGSVSGSVTTEKYKTSKAVVTTSSNIVKRPTNFASEYRTPIQNSYTTTKKVEKKDDSNSILTKKNDTKKVAQTSNDYKNLLRLSFIDDIDE